MLVLAQINVHDFDMLVVVLQDLTSKNNSWATDTWSGRKQSCDIHTKLTHLLQCREERCQEYRIIAGKVTCKPIKMRMHWQIQGWECKGDICVQMINGDGRISSWVDSEPGEKVPIEWFNIGGEGDSIIRDNPVTQEVMKCITKLGTDWEYDEEVDNWLTRNDCEKKVVETVLTNISAKKQRNKHSHGVA